MFAPVSTTIGHGTPSMWPITVKLSSLWVNVPVISTTCGVKLSEWLADLTPSRPAWISLKEAGSYAVACLLGYFGGNFDSHVFSVPFCHKPSTADPSSRFQNKIACFLWGLLFPQAAL